MRDAIRTWAYASPFEAFFVLMTLLFLLPYLAFYLPFAMAFVIRWILQQLTSIARWLIPGLAKPGHSQQSRSQHPFLSQVETSARQNPALFAENYIALCKRLDPSLRNAPEGALNEVRRRITTSQYSLNRALTEYLHAVRIEHDQEFEQAKQAMSAAFEKLEGMRRQNQSADLLKQADDALIAAEKNVLRLRFERGETTEDILKPFNARKT